MFKFEVDEKEANIILKGLGQLPLSECLDVFTKIKQQANEQIQRATENTEKEV